MDIQGVMKGDSLRTDWDEMESLKRTRIAPIYEPRSQNIAVCSAGGEGQCHFIRDAVWTCVQKVQEWRSRP